MALRPGFIATALLVVALACASSGESAGNWIGEGGGGQLSQGAAQSGGESGVGGSTPSSRGGKEGNGAAPGAGRKGSEDEPESEAGQTGVIPAGGAPSGESLLDAEGPCVLAPGLEGEVTVKLRANSDLVEEFIQGEVHVLNASARNLSLSELELRYFLDSEYEPDETDALLVQVDHAEKSGRVYTNIPREQLLTDVVLIEPQLPGADAYLSIGFHPQEGLLLPGETLRVKFRVEPPDSDYYAVARDQTNDYSFGACAKFAALWPRVVLLHGNELLSGEAPAGFSLPGPLGEGGAAGAGMGGASGGAAANGGAGEALGGATAEAGAAIF